MKGDSLIGRAASVAALLVGVLLGPAPSLAFATAQNTSGSARAASAAGSPCDGLSIGTLASPFSSYIATALPLLSQAGVDTSKLSTSIVPSVGTPPDSAQVPPEINESITAMRTLPRMDVHWQATFVAPVGSGWLILTPPDAVDGQGIVASRSWKVATNADQVAVQVNDQTVGTVPSKGISTTVRDVILSLPCNVPSLTATRDGTMDRFEGRLEPGVESDLIRQLTGLVLPGSPTGQISLAIDARTHVWRALEIRVIWPIVNLSILSHPIVWGPGGRIALTFGNEQFSADASSAALPRPSPSAAMLALGGIESHPALRQVAGPASLVFTFLDLRQIRAMREQEPVLRSAISTAWQQGGDTSTEYGDAIQRYRDWERQTPLVGPFLRYLFPGSSPP